MTHAFAYLDSPLPLALAHQGGDLEVPGNSRTALEHASQLGYRYFETDAHATADGVVVLMHDATLDRTTDSRGAIRELTWDQVSRARDASGQPPARLDEALRDYPQLRFNIDAKEDSVVRPLIRTVKDAGATGRVLLAAFADARVRQIRAELPGVATGTGRVEVARLLAASKAPARARRRLLAGLGRKFGRAAATQIPEVQSGIRVATPAYIKAAHELGIQVHVWTVNETADMARLLDLGVDGIITDRPTALKELLVQRGDWTQS